LPAQFARKEQRPKQHINTEALGNNQKEIKLKYQGVRLLEEEQGVR
jgi:hypothetical protein